MNPLVGVQRERVMPILVNPYTMGTVLYAIAVRQYGEEVHDWEPETVFLELQDDFGVEIPAINHDKLMALLTAVSTNSFYENFAAFSLISHTLNNDENPLDQSDPLLPAEMAWAVTEVQLVDDTPGKFGVDVAHAVGVFLQEDGFTSPPPKLSWAVIPSKYEGSSTSSDLGKERTISTEHAHVVEEYLRDQAATLIRQISALPWHDEHSLAEMIRDLQRL